MKTRNKWLCVAMVAALLLLSLAGAAAAQGPNQPRGPALHWLARLAKVRRVSAHRYAVVGKVKSIEAATLTVADRRDTYVIHTDGRTRFFQPGQETASLSDIHVGDKVLAVGKPGQQIALFARWVGIRRTPTADTLAPE